MIRFGNDTFTVTLEWSHFSGEMYSVVTVPEAMDITVTGNGNAQLVMLYNTEYNVTVTATLCGDRSASNFTTIHYGITCMLRHYIFEGFNFFMSIHNYYSSVLLYC